MVLRLEESLPIARLIPPPSTLNLHPPPSTSTLRPKPRTSTAPVPQTSKLSQPRPRQRRRAARRTQIVNVYPSPGAGKASVTQVSVANAPQKSPVRDAKEPCSRRKRALSRTQKSPVQDAKEPCTGRKRALYRTQKSPVRDAKEPCPGRTRALLLVRVPLYRAVLTASGCCSDKPAK